MQGSIAYAAVVDGGDDNDDGDGDGDADDGYIKIMIATEQRILYFGRDAILVQTTYYLEYNVLRN